MPKKESQSRKTCIIELPVEDGSAYAPRHIDLGALTKQQAENLKRVRDGLESSSARLANGRLVRGATDSVRYILENLNA